MTETLNGYKAQTPDQEAEELFAEMGEEDAFRVCVDTVIDEAQADWIMNMLLRWRSERERIAAAAEARCAKLDRLIQWFLRRFRVELEDYARAQIIAGNSRGKKVELPCGVALQFRNNPAALKITDEEAYTDWARTNLPKAYTVEVVEKVSKTEVNKWWQDNKQIPPGCEVRPPSESFSLGGFKLEYAGE